MRRAVVCFEEVKKEKSAARYQVVRTRERICTMNSGAVKGMKLR